MANQYPNLERQIREAEATALNRDIERTTTEEGIKGLGLFYWKTYKGTPEQQRAKWVKFLTRKNAERVAAQVGKLEATTNAPEFSGALIVSLDWTRSRIWGSNPRAHTNYGFLGKSISGCGYCKQSTALSQGLNSHLPLMKLLYAAKERGEKLPYGAGYGVLPYFEGGVGSSAHRSIVEALGLEFEAITQAKNADTFIIRRKEVPASEVLKLIREGKATIYYNQERAAFEERDVFKTSDSTAAELIANLNAARLVKSQPWVYGLPDEAAKWTDAEITASMTQAKNSDTFIISRKEASA